MKSNTKHDHDFNKLMLFIATICILTVVNAQNFFYIPSKIMNEPAHPLMEKLEYIREEADSIIYEVFDGEGKPITGSGYSIIKRNKSELTDTVYSHAGIFNKYVMMFDADHKLTMNRFYGPESPLGDLYQYYTYDQKGRVRTIVSFRAPDLKDTIEVQTYSYLDNQAIQSDSGYIHTIIHEIGEKSEIVRKDTSSTEYVFDVQNRLIRAGNKRYYYLQDGGLKVVDYSTDNLRKTEYYSDKERQNWKRAYYYALDGGKWKMYEYEEGHSFKNGIPLAAELITAHTQPIAYGTRGGAVITKETEQPVRIYTLNGQLVKQIYTCSNQFIPLSRGLYILTTGDRSCKVLVN